MEIRERENSLSPANERIASQIQATEHSEKGKKAECKKNILRG